MRKQFKCPSCKSKNFHYVRHEDDPMIGTYENYHEEWYCNDCKFEYASFNWTQLNPQDHAGEYPVYIGKWGIYDEIERGRIIIN